MLPLGHALAEMEIAGVELVPRGSTLRTAFERDAVESADLPVEHRSRHT